MTKNWLVIRVFSLVFAVLLVGCAAWVGSVMRDYAPPFSLRSRLNHSAASIDAKDFLMMASVNLNTADRAELMQINGVGMVLSKRILEYRNEHGDFESIEQLDNIRGIGEKTLVRIAEQAYVPES